MSQGDLGAGGAWFPEKFLRDFGVSEADFGVPQGNFGCSGTFWGAEGDEWVP